MQSHLLPQTLRSFNCLLKLRVLNRFSAKITPKYMKYSIAFTQGGRDGCVWPLWSLKYRSWFPATDSSENFDWQRLMPTTPSPAHMCRSVSGPHLNTIENSWNNNGFSLLTLNRVFLIHLSLKTSLFSNKTLPLIATDICQNFNF